MPTQVNRFPDPCGMPSVSHHLASSAIRGSEGRYPLSPPPRTLLMLSQPLQRLQSLLRGNTLKTRSARGVLWIGGGNGLEQAARLVRNVVLARVLAPQAFGLMAIVLAVNQVFDSFTEVGIKQAVIQHENAEEKTYLNAAWWLAFLRSAGLYLFAFLVAPLVAEFYREPELTALLRVAFLNVLFRGMISPNAYIALKQMKFGRWVFLAHGGGLIGIVTAIVLSIQLGNVWGLVIGFTMESFARTFLSFVFFPFLPGLRLTREHSLALLRFAGGMAGLPILTFIFQRVDVFVIGKLCTKHDLGLYSLASSLAFIPMLLFGTLIREIALPAFTTLRNDPVRLDRALLTVTRAIAYVGFPLLFFMVGYGEPLLTLIYGPEYAAVAAPFALVTARSLLVLCSTPLAGIYFALGEPARHRRFTAIRAVIICLLIYPAVHWYGLLGGAGAGLAAIILSYYFQLVNLKSILAYKIGEYAKVFFFAVLGSMILVVVWLVTRGLAEESHGVQLAVGGMSCVAAVGYNLVRLRRQMR